MKNLLLINPRSTVNSGLSASSQSRFPPLGLGVIASLTPSSYNVRIIDENFEPFEYTDAHIVGITVFTSAAVRAYEIAALYRARGIPVVLGGIHVSMMPDEALNYADAVVTGEAEGVWPTLVQDFEAGCLKRVYSGGAADLSEAVFPGRELFHPDYGFASVQTSRGCPMDCSFCSVSVFNGKKYRQRPVNDVLDELETIPQKLIFFVDDNIIGYGSSAAERAIELFRGMVERGINKSWFCQASLNFGDEPEVLKWAAKSGCRMVFLGLEAVDDDELAGMNKNLNIRLEYRKAFENIHKAGIAVLGAFIFGSDTDTEKTIKRKTDYILREDIDVIQVTTLTPLPGTRLFGEVCDAGRLLYSDFPNDWVHFDMTELTFEPNKIRPDVFNRINEEQQRRLLSLPVLIRKFLQTMIRTRSLETALWALNSNLVYRKSFLCNRKKAKAQSPGMSAQPSLSETI